MGALGRMFCLNIGLEKSQLHDTSKSSMMVPNGNGGARADK